MKPINEVLHEQVSRVKKGMYDFEGAYDEIYDALVKEGYKMYKSEYYTEEHNVYADELYTYLDEKLTNDEEIICSKVIAEKWDEWNTEWDFRGERTNLSVTFKVVEMWIEGNDGGQRELTHMLTAEIDYEDTETFDEWSRFIEESCYER